MPADTTDRYFPTADGDPMYRIDGRLLTRAAALPSLKAVGFDEDDAADYLNALYMDWFISKGGR